MLSFLHSADWQIGKPYARVKDPDKRARLRQVRLEAIAGIGRHVQARQAAFLLIAGDLFDSPTPSSSDVSAVCQAIGNLTVPVLVIPGNHDHGAPGSVWHSSFFRSEQQRRAPNLQVLLNRQVLELEHAIVLPCPLLRRSDSDDPCAWLRQIAWADLPTSKPRLVLAHGSVHGFGGADLDADEENPAATSNRLQLDDALLQELDYVALGDWHGMKAVNPKTWYSGTPEPDRFPRTPDYRGSQVLGVQLVRGGQAEVEPLATGQLAWHPLRFHFNGDADLPRLEEQLDRLLGQEPGQHLLLLEESGSLSLEGHRHYEALIERLEAQLLRLKRRGRCQQEPGAEELAELTGRPGDPLIARVAADLHSALEEANSTDSADTAQVLRLALSELHRCVNLVN